MIAAALWKFESPGFLLFLLAVPVVALGLWLVFLRQRRALIAFAGNTPRETTPSPARALAKVILNSLGITALIIAIARPQADPIEQDSTVRGRDIAFVIDVSRSMLSRDVVPSRLERAKIWINDLANTLRGDRVGLVAFAGVPVVVCPLTLDYGFFRMSLDEMTPATSPRGGTMIGDAIRKTMSDVFEPGAGRYRDIILITDGEDQGSFPVEAAQKAGEMGIRIIALGIGSELQGAPVPEKDTGGGFIQYDGQQVRSKLDSTTLAKITAAAAQARGDVSGGVFLNVGTGTIDLDKVYRDLIATAERRETQTKANVIFRELFPYFIALSLLCLAIEPAIGLRVRRAARASTRLAPVAAAIAMLMICVPARAQTETPASLYNAGRELFTQGKFAEAADHFQRADQGAADAELSARSRFNLGQSLLKQGADPKADPAQSLAKLESAARAFRSVLDVKPGDAEAARNVEIARRLMKDAQKRQQEQSGEKNQKSDEHQKNADKLKDLAKQQSDAADKSDEAQKQESPEQQQSKTQESRQQQEQVNKGTQEQREQKDSASETQQQLDQAQQEQKAAKEALDRGDPKSAEEHQRKAAEHLEQASQSEQKAAEDARKQEQKDQQGKQDQAKQDQSKQDQKQNGKQDAAKPDPKQEQKQDEPKRDETAAQLLDKERKQREARQQVLRALRGKPQPVEKDW